MENSLKKANHTELLLSLRDSVVIAEDGKTILEIFDDFKDPEALNRKGVEWNPALERLGVQKEYFDSLLAKYIAYGKKICCFTGTT